jgi:hypothetical protein
MEKDQLEYLGLNGTKWILKKFDGDALTGLLWLWIWTGVGLL